MAGKNEKLQRELASLRDTIESIWVAIVLAFVLRAFVVEAFVIPTGSMAPRLLGEHWDLQCPSCGYEYAFGWGQKGEPIRGRGETFGGAECPNCGHEYPGTEKKHLVNTGDRVLVMKLLYQFMEPKRWDVVVFRNPQSNHDNYIKRLIGLPGESIEIVLGDIFVTRTPGKMDSWRVGRKPPRAQKAMWHIIFDNDYRPGDQRIADDLAPRWQAVTGADKWNLGAARGRRFVFSGSAEPAELAFRAPRERFLPNYGYNPNSAPSGKALYSEADVCGDLKLSAVFVPKADDARISLMLAGRDGRFKVQINADGLVTLYRRTSAAGHWDQWDRRNVEPLKVDRGYQVVLANADFRVTVRVGGKVVVEKDYDDPSDYKRLKTRLAAFEDYLRGAATTSSQGPEKLFPTPELKIVAEGGASELMHVKVHRDVYYVCRQLEDIDSGPLGEYANDKRSDIEAKTDVWAEKLREGEHGGTAGRGWGVTGNPIKLHKADPDLHQDPDLDEFFVLGDNSPQSLDGRMWTNAAPTLRLWTRDGKRQYKLGTVPRYNMIGKAIFVYWPSGFRPPYAPSLPIVPNVGRMRLIR